MKARFAIPLAIAVVAGVLLATGIVPGLDRLKDMAGLDTGAPTQKSAPKSQRAAPAAPAPAVSVERIGVADFTQSVLVTGSLVPRTEVLVAPEIEGLRVMALEVEEGDRVRKGQVLARLVQDGLEAQIAQNDAARAKAEAGIAQARSQIAQAEARDVEARANFERAEPLRKSGTLSQSVFEQREAAARSAAALLRAARDGLKVAEAELAQVAAQRRELQWRMSNTEVKAPEDGIVSRRTARLGGLASAAGDPMFRIIARGAIELEALVPESQLSRLREGQTAKLTVAGHDDVTGKVRLVAPEIDKATRLGRVRILIDRPEGLKIGAFARGIIDTARSRGLSVPASAVLFTSSGPVVQVVRDGVVASQRVEIGLRSGDRIEIRSGVSDGDLVVAKAGTFLREGDKVRAMDAGPQKISGVN